jgi:hypothetical protein
MNTTPSMQVDERAVLEALYAMNDDVAWIRTEGERAVRHMAAAEDLADSVTQPATYYAIRTLVEWWEHGMSVSEIAAVAAEIQRIAQQSAVDGDVIDLAP